MQGVAPKSWSLPKPITLICFSFLPLDDRPAVKATCKAFSALMKESKSLPTSLAFLPLEKDAEIFTKELDGKSADTLILNLSFFAVSRSKVQNILRNVKVKNLTINGSGGSNVEVELSMLDKMTHPNSVQKLEINDLFEEHTATRMKPLARLTSLSSLHIGSVDTKGHMPLWSVCCSWCAWLCVW